MAVKWAVANGNWNDGATWNDGIFPVDGDYVYANGHTIQLNYNVSLPNSVISNGICPNTGIGGGVFQATLSVSAQRIISFGEYRAYGTNIILMSGQQASRLIINGNIYVDGGVGVVCNTGNYGIYCTINGNIYSNVDVMTGAGSNYSLGLTIVGNITNTRDDDGSIAIFGVNRSFSATISGGFDGFVEIKREGGVATLTYVGNKIVLTNAITTATITGDVELKNNVSVTTATITGRIIANGYVLTGTTLNINGSITYKSTNNTIGVRYTNLNILNPDTFTWKDITTPRSNPFIIVTDAEMNNRQQYPPENEVKQGTEYVWGEKVGTYQQPPKSVVLKDYVYDNGERTGTLENEVTVNVGCTNPQDVRKDIPLANMGTVGTMVIPLPQNVLEGTIYDNGTEGTLESQSTADYPAEDKVLIGTSYDHDNKIGTLEPGGDNPQESDVRFGVPYNHNLNTGKAHIPSSQNVRKNVLVEDTVGQIVIPRASEVKKDVEFDIDSVGTMESTVQTNNTINVYRKR